METVRRRITIFYDRHPLVGPLFWITSAQYFITQLAVAGQWTQSYSIAHNTISDLGNTICGVYDSRYVCSPAHAWMDASFIVLGLTMMAGSGLIYQEFRERRGSAPGFSGMALAGFGTVLVGLFPENTIGSLHFFGALLPFLIGNLAMIILGASLSLPRVLKLYTILSGAVSLIALVGFETHTYIGLGSGGMERIVAYPQTLWLIVFGLYMSRNHYLRKH